MSFCGSAESDPSLTSNQELFLQEKDGTWPWARQENWVVRASCPQAWGSLAFLGLASLDVAHPRDPVRMPPFPSSCTHLLFVSLRLVNTFQPPSQYHCFPSLHLPEHKDYESPKSSFWVPPSGTPKLAHPTWDSISSHVHVQVESLESGT